MLKRCCLTRLMFLPLEYKFVFSLTNPKKPTSFIFVSWLIHFMWPNWKSHYTWDKTKFHVLPLQTAEFLSAWASFQESKWTYPAALRGSHLFSRSIVKEFCNKTTLCGAFLVAPSQKYQLTRLRFILAPTLKPLCKWMIHIDDKLNTNCSLGAYGAKPAI